MEQKRTLWIIAAVGVFLLVVLGAALILYSPKTRPVQSVTSNKLENMNNSNGWISLAPAKTEEQSVPSQLENIPSESVQETAAVENNFSECNISEKNISDNKTIHVHELTVYADNTNYIDNSTKDLRPANPAATVINNTTTIDLNTYTENLQPAKPQKEERKAENVKPVEKPVVKAETKTSVKPAVKQTTKTVKPASKQVSKPQSVKAPEKLVYWVQVTSLTSRKNADKARDVLAENKINADVFTYTDAKGQLFYRVRVGPYTTKSEAEYWRGKISQIDTFKTSASYVASTKVQE